MQVPAFLLSRLDDAGSQWSLGTFGAIAEFMRDPHEPVHITCKDGMLSACTARGAIRFDRLDEVRLVASETASRESWNHRVALCLPADRCAMGRRTVLTELGSDAAAIRAGDRSALLFDLGLGALQLDACVRTADPDLIMVLRAQAGRSLFDSQSRALSAILRHSPHRVFASRFGRIEVFQPIPPAEGRSPEGPHTHVLPNLLRHGMTHAATEPIPEGWVPCAHVYPPHPAKDALGRRRPFHSAVHESFQVILRQFGDADLLEVKHRAWAALKAGKDPLALGIANSRFARNSLRVAVLQWTAVAGALNRNGYAVTKPPMPGASAATSPDSGASLHMP